jgi:hypothetical protein
MKTTLLSLVTVLAVAMALVPACGAGNDTSETLAGSGSSGDTGSTSDTGEKDLASISIEPAQAAVEIVNGEVVVQKFAAIAHYSDGSTEPITSGLTWSADASAVGAVDAGGTFTPSAQQGGLVAVSAGYSGQTGTASLAVKLHEIQNPGNIDPAVQAKIKDASTPDATVVWFYPYDGTVFPRGLPAPLMMWENGAATDQWYIHIASPYCEIEIYGASLSDAEWAKLSSSTSGKADVAVNRWDGQNATQIAHHTWTIAPAPIRSSVYYWAQDVLRVMRLEPGAGSPDDFTKDAYPSADPAGCTIKCHAVSADGSTFVGGGAYGGSYDLKSSTIRYSLPGAGTDLTRWTLPAVSPDGQYVAINANMSPAGTPLDSGMFSTFDGSLVATSGVPVGTYMPVFSPDGTSFAYVIGEPATLANSTAKPGPLHVLDFDQNKDPMLSNDRELVQAGDDPSNQVIAWPTLSPDGRWALYGRLAWREPATINNLVSFNSDPPPAGDLYMADLETGTEVRLAQLDGDGYPFGAGDRDRHLSFEPSFAPIASGGYFWVAFHSRRTYGSVLKGTLAEVKQVWIAAIDQNPKPGQDPSHPAFRLPGQSAAGFNQQARFAMNPCKSDSQDCQSGTDCCSGHCGAAGACGAKSGCSQNGDRCDESADCCDAAAAVTCINHVCSEPTPR